MAQYKPVIARSLDELLKPNNFEGPLPYVGDIHPLEKLDFDFSSQDKATFSEYYLNFLAGANADPVSGWWDRNAVKEVTFTGGHVDVGPLVDHLLPMLGGLEIVRWYLDDYVSDAMLKALIRNPPVKLYYKLYSMKQGEFSNTTTPNLAIVNSSALYSLAVDITYGSEENYEGMDFIFDAMRNATNLRELDIKMEFSGCVVGAYVPWAFPFSYYEDIKFPPLEVLKLDGYDFNERSDGGQAWASKGKTEEWAREWQKWADEDEDDIPPPARPKRPDDDGRTNLDAWLQVMDWTNLHTLKLGGGSASNKALTRLKTVPLPALKNLSLSTNNPQPGEVEDYLPYLSSLVTPLKSLAIQEPDGSLKNKLLQQMLVLPNLTQDLRHFSYRTGGADTQMFRKPLFDTFMASLPKIKYIDKEVPRMNLTTATGFFDTMLASTTLKKLTLRFPSPDLHYGSWMSDEHHIQYSQMRLKYIKEKDETDEPDPLVNHNNALAFFKEMRSKKQGAELEELEFVVGEWDDRYRSVFPAQYMMRTAHWTCTVNWDGEECEGSQTRLHE